MNFFVLRIPLYMEDNGRYVFAESFSSRIEAQEWVDKQLVPGDYIITERSHG